MVAAGQAELLHLIAEIRICGLVGTIQRVGQGTGGRMVEWASDSAGGL